MDDSFLDIDIHKLEEEWQNQPKLFFEYSLKLADARKELLFAKASLSVVREEVAKKVREWPTKYGLKKPTGAAIKAVVDVQKEVLRKNREIRKIRHVVGTLTAAVRALEHRKTALQNEVLLHGQQYFSLPSIERKRGRHDKD